MQIISITLLALIFTLVSNASEIRYARKMRNSLQTIMKAPKLEESLELLKASMEIQNDLRRGKTKSAELLKLSMDLECQNRSDKRLKSPRLRRMSYINEKLTTPSETERFHPKTSMSLYWPGAAVPRRMKDLEIGLPDLKLENVNREIKKYSEKDVEQKMHQRMKSIYDFEIPSPTMAIYTPESMMQLNYNRKKRDRGITRKSKRKNRFLPVLESTQKLVNPYGVMYYPDQPDQSLHLPNIQRGKLNSM